MVGFFRAGEAKPAAEYEILDLYGWGNSGPTPLETLFQAIRWSPMEDFALLDAEKWAEAPRAPVRAAVALNPDLKWESAPYALMSEIWLDNLHVLGERRDDCDYNVNLFDGRLGKTLTVRRARRPIGYIILDAAADGQGRATGKDIILAKTLDRCQECDSKRMFIPECFAFDPHTYKTRLAPCPDYDWKTWSDEDEVGR
jgi:hypothetical protein